MFHGSMVAIVTPMQSNGSLDLDALKRLLDWHISQNTDAFIVAGSTGEGNSLSDKERTLLIETAVDHVNGRRPVLAGTGASATARTIELTKQALAMGVDACLVVCPMYIKPTQEGLYRHFSALAEATPIPFIIYNAPGRTACDILPETLGRLSKVSSIIGVKDSTGDPKRLAAMQAACGDSFDYYTGDDYMVYDFMQGGGKGNISVVANFAPALMHELCAQALKKNFAEAKKIDEKLKKLYSFVSVETNPIPAKWALHEMGLIETGIRLPLLKLSEKHQVELKRALQEAELLVN